MKEIAVSDLKNGMIIASDIFSKKGSLLLYKGFKVENPELVSVVLTRNNIKTVEIKDVNDASTAKPVEKVRESDKVSERIYEEVTEFKEEFNDLVQDLTSESKQFSETKNIETLGELDGGSKIAQSNESSILTIFQLVEKVKNDGTDKFSDMLQISLLSYSIGKWSNLTEEHLKELSQAALLHGIFTENEITKNNISSILGTEKISDTILTSALFARERNDGSGPAGLIGDEIPLYSKIIAIAEVFYTLTTPGEFKERLSVFDALKIMQSEYMPVLDTKILYDFMHRVSSKYIGSTVRLSDGTSGVIVFVPDTEISFPYIKTEEGNVINLQNPEYKHNKIIEIL